MFPMFQLLRGPTVLPFPGFTAGRRVTLHAFRGLDACAPWRCSMMPRGALSVANRRCYAPMSARFLLRSRRTSLSCSRNPRAPARRQQPLLRVRRVAGHWWCYVACLQLGHSASRRSHSWFFLYATQCLVVAFFGGLLSCALPAGSADERRFVSCRFRSGIASGSPELRISRLGSHRFWPMTSVGLAQRVLVVAQSRYYRCRQRW
mmetsp:Transcript_39624/g.86495  ORF Transcript_39624/g.86495 Transcript_39624/m.86495 type:complete len:205 (+) Transcript_39624:3140-3754(+)